jgi:hypothetical protein
MITEEYIKKMINRCYPQEGICMVPKKSLDYTKEIMGGWTTINSMLDTWRDMGLIRILKYPGNADDNEICIEILRFLDGKDFPENWIRDR